METVFRPLQILKYWIEFFSIFLLVCHHGAAGVGSTLDDLWRSMACLDSLTLRARLVALPHKHPQKKTKPKRKTQDQ